MITHLPRYLLAKYIPDLSRMEPRNIGIILWVRGKIACKFLETPGFLNEDSAYARWCDFWKHETSGSSIQPIRGEAIPVDDPACLVALMSTQDGNFRLVDSGELLEKVKMRDISRALNMLYDELVAVEQPRSKREHLITFAKECDKLMTDSGLRAVQGFRTKYDLSGSVYGITKHMQFHYGIEASKDGEPLALFQRVSIDHDNSVHDAALKIHSVLSEERHVPKNRCVAMIQSGQIAKSTNGAADNHKLLQSLCLVVDIDDAINARKQLAETIGNSNISLSSESRV